MTDLVGRTAQVAAIADALSSVNEGARAIQVRADAGMGKTVLLDETARRARDAGFLVLRGAGVEAPGTMAYAALADALGPALDEVAPGLPDPLREAVEIAVLRRRAPENEIDPHAVARASLTTLELLARDRPVLVLLDDVHWLDPETARVFSFLLPRLGAARVAVVLATRDERPRSAVDLGGALRSMPGERGNGSILLTTLSLEETARLIASDGGRPLGRGELKQVHEVSDGNPLFSLELARSLRQAEPGSGLSLPSSLGELIERRVRTIPDQAIAALATVALVPRSTRDLVTAATGLSEREVDSALDIGLDAGVITEHDGVLAFTHPLVGLAISTAAPTTYLRAAHRRLAGLVGDPEQRASHLAQAVSRRDAAAAAQIEEGAELARRRAAPDVAAQLGEGALRITPPGDTADLRRRHLATAYHHVAAGSLPAALDHVGAALELTTEREEVADLEWRRAMFHFLQGDIDAATAGLEVARDLTSNPHLRDELTRRLATMLGWQGRMRDALEQYGEDLERISRTDEPAAATALAILLICRHVLGLPLPADPVEQIHLERSRHSDLLAHDDPSIRLAAATLTSTDAPSAAALLESALKRAEAQGDDLGIAWLGSRVAIAACCAGDWQRAEEAAVAGLHAAERLDSPPALAYAVAGRGIQAALAGNDPAASAAADRLHPSGPFMFAAPQAALIRGYVAWTNDDLDLAVSLFDEAERDLRDLGIVEPTVASLRWYRADLLIDAGRREEAAAEAEQLLRLGTDCDHTIALAIGHRARGRLEEDPEHFETALTLHDIHGWPFERAITQYHHGTVLRRLRRVRDARTALTQAMDVFTRLGTTYWTERCAAEIARLGGRTAQPGALTQSESRVAELAVRGMTNQEIAAELVISARTVASHLSSAYSKLGARSRTELASRLAAR